MTNRHGWLLVGLAMVPWLAGCGGSDSSGSTDPSTTGSGTTTPPVSTSAPQIKTQPANQTVSVGQTAVFDVTVSGSAPLEYQWQKNGSAITGATGSSYTVTDAALGDNGAKFTVTVINWRAARPAAPRR